MNKKVIIYTDGSCFGNPGKGGWGAILIYGNVVKELSGFEDETTNNKMELRATIEALKALNQSCDIEINTDSAYVKKGITEWIKIWKNNNWKTANKKPVKNEELWKELDSQITRHNIEWKWVKAHNGNKWNDRADLLARGDVKPNT